MFTGIIEAFGQISAIQREGSNVHFTVASPISSELKIDQSVAHNGVCLTVVAVDAGTHQVTAIDETLQRSNLSQLQVGSLVNLERAMRANARLDGHFVQGHVDVTGICTEVKTLDGSWVYSFEYPFLPEYLLVDKGSICVNGVSLTVVRPDISESEKAHFSVAIIPYTFEHTNFKNLKKGDFVNLEFDVIGKYVARHLALYAAGV
ncbi:MAG: riboflavin synthase [Saprospiraceae bacterium]|nr:riboflavin synthase [Saprospiraceae bacterium]MCF8251083.1 riboflavin synthase [Saprospiraceae bacterium]MCF8280368.1 riboflavin synthase [Bacteroidales bacterium]MCF8312861.1 riboflavin synthase [Saprospiraceae bacterium]MCF8441342.1 riboflavin synthase [Saprospiraceae bacterium]